MPLDSLALFRNIGGMTALSRFLVAFLACVGLALTATGGPQPMLESSKESKEIALPPPPACDWSGIYVGLHAGGQFGDSTTEDVDFWNGDADLDFDYGESGFVGGGQIGYNHQWNWLVFGPEFDLGYMDLNGGRVQPGSPGDDSRGSTDSDFYVSLRGRVGASVNWSGCWLFYVTGGAIGVNYTTRFIDDCVGGNCGPGLIDARRTEFNWGPTVGAGIERQIGRHWSIKIEYLFFDLDEQRFSAIESPVEAVARRAVPAAPQGDGMTLDRFRFDGETQGHIVRGGLNFRF